MIARESCYSHDALRIIDVPIVLSQMTTLFEIGDVDLRAVLAEESRIKSLQREVYSLVDNRQN